MIEHIVPVPTSKLPPLGAMTMYAIAFDLDTDTLARSYPSTSWQHAYRDVKVFLTARGFLWQQGSVYFGDVRVTPVTCVLAVQELAQVFPWFSRCARDVRMLRIDENNDLRPAIDAANEG